MAWWFERKKPEAKKLNRIERNRIKVLERRAGFLRRRIGMEPSIGNRDLSYDKAELSALEWAIGKLKLGLVLVLIAVVGVGCRPTYVWESRSQELKSEAKVDGDCVYRALRLSNEMTEAGVPHDVVWGYFKGFGHVWLEMDGVRLEPNEYGYSDRNYKEKARRHIAENKISFAEIVFPSGWTR